MKIEVEHHFPRKFEIIHRISQPVHFSWRIGRPELKERRIPIMIEASITNEQKIKVTVNPTTLAGKPVALDGPIAVTVQSGEGTVQMVDEKSFYAVSGDNPGDTAYLVNGDADLGAGVENIADVLLLHVAGAKAANLGLVLDVAELK